MFILGLALGARRFHRARLLSSTTLVTTAERDSICAEENAYYPVVGQCDLYYECIRVSWKVTVKLCSDGLLYKLETPFMNYPCL